MSEKKEKVKLEVEKRKVIGKKVKLLRRDGLLPANIYGKKTKSLAVQLPAKLFLSVFKEVGESGLLDLKVGGEDAARPVLVHDVHFHPVSNEPLHVDFYQVDLKEKVITKVPVEIIGESPAIKEKIGILIQPLSEVEVEALPGDLPEKIEVDISGLKAVDETITVDQVKAPQGVQILTEAKEVLAKIEPPVTQEEIVVPPTEETVEGETPEVEVKEGETPTEGEESAKEEESKEEE
jgi:large subunit ribosomal protein L25